MSSEIKSLPLVSCLCVTNGKPGKLQRAISCFLTQSYQHKELVILYGEQDKVTKDIVEEYNKEESIVWISIPNHTDLTIGELRNITIEACNGDFFCTWDDDDWYHKDRIRLQLEYILANHQSACLLTNVIIYDELTKKAHQSTFRLFENSILTKKGRRGWQPRYPHLPRYEDSFFVNALLEDEQVIPFIRPDLYIYTCHMNNTSSRGHLEALINHSQPLGDEVSEKIAKILSGEFSPDEAADFLASPAFLSPLKLLKDNSLNMSDMWIIEAHRKKRLSRAHFVIEKISKYFNNLELKMRLRIYEKSDLDTQGIRELMDI